MDTGIHAYGIYAGHGRHMGMDIWWFGCIRLGSFMMLIHMHMCNGLGQHESKLMN